ncbi:hypothetical protein L1987_67430 [Smallanthus sonchifolius]|uniref:Uncharacterized protein n=1 Tax=Smallanthus sonchifolius TaxID=185202 RepID=A0ACB9B2C9_9ASTR|nr:hypothetical protein L1987_67430 [Smallanthus sonchifolius]
MKPTEVAMKSGNTDLVSGKREVSNNKPQFRPATDDTKPLLQDPTRSRRRKLFSDCPLSLRLPQLLTDDSGVIVSGS